MSEFQREKRYLVLKHTDILKHLSRGEQNDLAVLSDAVEQGRRDSGKDKFDCVVVEHDWPEYQPTWEAIEKRMSGVDCTACQEYLEDCYPSHGRCDRFNPKGLTP